MSIIEWLNSDFDAGVFIPLVLVGFLIWFIIWKLISKLFEKHKLYGLLELGAIGGFCVLIFLSLIGALFVASIQVVMGFGLKMLFPLIIFWGGIIAFFVFLIRELRK